jgi:hypothetical protein
MRIMSWKLGLLGMAVGGVFLAGRESSYVYSLLQMTHSSNAAERFAAIREIGGLPKWRAQCFVSRLLVVAQKDADSVNAAAALSELGNIAPNDSRTIALLTDLIVSDDDRRRAGACASFGLCESLPEQVKEAMKAMAAGDHSPLVRISAAWTLNQHGLIGGAPQVT